MSGREFCGGSVNPGGFALDHRSHARDLRFRLLPLFQLDGFTDSGNGLYAVAGVKTWSVEQVLEPRAHRQSLLRYQFALAFEEHAVHLGDSRVCQTRAAVFARFGQSLFITLRAVREGIRGIFERRKIQVWRDLLEGWRNIRLLRIRGRRENAFLDFQIALADSVGLVLGELFQLVDVSLKRLGEI